MQFDRFLCATWICTESTLMLVYRSVPGHGQTDLAVTHATLNETDPGGSGFIASIFTEFLVFISSIFIKWIDGWIDGWMDVAFK